MRNTKGYLAALVVALLAYMALVAVFSDGSDLHNTWGSSAEFSQLATGQERFSEHETNVDGLIVVVDHETGAQYVVTGGGVCPLLDADGTPLLVAEAGE